MNKFKIGKKYKVTFHNGATWKCECTNINGNQVLLLDLYEVSGRWFNIAEFKSVKRCL